MKEYTRQESLFNIESLFQTCKICCRMGWPIRRDERNENIVISYPLEDDETFNFIFSKKSNYLF